jgi:hypothetical protein
VASVNLFVELAEDDPATLGISDVDAAEVMPTRTFVVEDATPVKTPMGVVLVAEPSVDVKIPMGVCWGLVLKCYELRTRQHRKMLIIKVLRPSKHYFPWDVMAYGRRLRRAYLHKFVNQ